jgi:hypothetical protein
MSLWKVSAALSLLLSVAISGCNQQPQSTAPVKRPPSVASQQWAELTNGLINEYFSGEPAFAAKVGKHEYDGQLPDYSAHGLKRTAARLHDARDKIAAVDAATLEPNERFDREYLLSVMDRDLFYLDKAHFPSSNPHWYQNDLDPDMYLNRNYAPLEQRMKAFIKFARAVPKAAKDIQDNLKGPLPKPYVQLGIDMFGGFADFYKKDVAATFSSVSNADLQKDLTDADNNASNAMAILREYMNGLMKTANDKYALGKDLFQQMVKDSEAVDMPVEAIEAAGKADLDRNTELLKTECATYLPKATLAACVAKVSAKKPPEGTLEAARKQLESLKAFVQQNSIASIPSPEQALVAEAPPYNRSNAAFIQVPGPYDSGVPAVYNIAPPDPKWSKAEQAAYVPGEVDLLFISVHEVWPGHYLQFLHSNANPDKLEGIWVGYAFAEGWAHYCEEMMYDQGLGKGDPEKHIGQLVEALLRDVRLLSAIGLHTEGMTVAQSEQMFKEKAFQDPGNARQQAARGTYDPAYLNYTLGKLMIKKLRADWMAKAKGGDGTAQAPAASAATDASAASSAAAPAATSDQALLHDFHDKFLSYGGPPIPLVRKQMVGDGGALL